MPRRTDGEKVDELQLLVTQISTQLTVATNALDALDKAHQETRAAGAALRGDCERELAVLKHNIEELRRWMEKNGTGDLKTELAVLKEKTAKLEADLERRLSRGWSLLLAILSPVVSVLLAAAVAYFVARP